MPSPQRANRAAGPYPRPTTETHVMGVTAVEAMGKRMFSRRSSPHILQKAYFLLAKMPCQRAGGLNLIFLSCRCSGAGHTNPADQSLLEERPRASGWGVAAPRGLD